MRYKTSSNKHKNNTSNTFNVKYNYNQKNNLCKKRSNNEDKFKQDKGKIRFI